MFFRDRKTSVGRLRVGRLGVRLASSHSTCRSQISDSPDGDAPRRPTAIAFSSYLRDKHPSLIESARAVEHLGESFKPSARRWDPDQPDEGGRRNEGPTPEVISQAVDVRPLSPPSLMLISSYFVSGRDRHQLEVSPRPLGTRTGNERDRGRRSPPCDYGSHSSRPSDWQTSSTRCSSGRIFGTRLLGSTRSEYSPASWTPRRWISRQHQVSYPR